jgi:hypothetical protein
MFTLKRLESSVEAFRLTLGKIEGTVDKTLSRLESRPGSLSDLAVNFEDLDVDIDDEANVDALSFGEKIKIDLDDIDVESWQRDLWNDRETRELLDEMRKVTPERDLKLLVAETKGSLSTLQLKGVEDAKIECARRFFASLSEKNGQDVKYDVVTNYAELMQLVAG